MGKRDKYSLEELNIIEQFYPYAEWDELLEMLPNRNKGSIVKQANKMGIVRNSHALSIEDVKNLIKDRPYKMIESSFTTLSNGFDAVTEDGYVVKIARDNIYRDKIPEKFSKSNPHTIENIQRYIIQNNIPVKLLSTEYHGNRELLKWECQCGDIFYVSWNNFLTGKHFCNHCSWEKQGLEHRISISEVENGLINSGYKILSYENVSLVSNSKFSVEDKSGYRYDINWYSFKSGKIPEKFEKSNPFTIFNINRFLELTGREDYRCISTRYINNTSPLDILHIPCGTIFQSSLSEIQGKTTKSKTTTYYKECPTCKNKLIESHHASALKQVFVHELPDTVFEERSCVNPKTGYSMPTDIVNHRLKIAIEIQSHWHDLDGRKEKDEYKKNFWINKGYSFYSPDIRNYSILQLIQLFFPYITEIPRYVKFDFSKTSDFIMVQELLNRGYSISAISEMTGIKHGTINNLIHMKKVVLPEDYKQKVLNMKPIIQLDLSGNFIKRFPTISSTKESGHIPSSVCAVIHGRRKTHHNSYWLYEENYLSGNYELPNEK